jgi:hypothetical protein
MHSLVVLLPLTHSSSSGLLNFHENKQDGPGPTGVTMVTEGACCWTATSMLGFMCCLSLYLTGRPPFLDRNLALWRVICEQHMSPDPNDRHKSGFPAAKLTI